MELVEKLRAEIKSGNKTAGLDMDKGIIGDMSKLGIQVRFRETKQKSE